MALKFTYVMQKAFACNPLIEIYLIHERIFFFKKIISFLINYTLINHNLINRNSRLIGFVIFVKLF